MNKTCTHCGTEKPIEAFNKNKNTADGHSMWCRDCMKAAYDAKHYKQYVQKNPHIHRKSHLKLKYAITPEQYATMLQEQGGKCAICGDAAESLPKQLLVDHDHETSKVRGLLCPRCNHGLGRFRDSITDLEAAIVYLRKTQNE
jgi:hypothetical protein